MRWLPIVRGNPASVRTGVFWAAVGNTAYLGCQYAMLMAIARLGTTTNVGEFAYAQAIVTPIMVFSQMQLRQLQVTDVRNSVRFGHYLATRTAATALALVAVAAAAVVSRSSGTMLLVIGGVALAKAFESMSDIAHGRLQHHERLDLVARSLVAKGALSLVALSAILWATGSLVLAVIGLALVWGALLFCYDLPLTRRLGSGTEASFEWDGRLASKLARTALPLALASGLGSLSSNLPRYFLDAAHGKSAVALFAVATTPLALLGLGNSAVSQATLARAAFHFQSGEMRLFSRLAQRITLIQVLTAVLIALLFALFGAPLMSLLFGPEFTPAAPVAVVMALGMGVAGVAAWGSAAIAAGRRFSLQLWNVVIMMAAQLPLCWWLTREYGAVGAGWSEFARYCVSTVFLVAAGFIVLRAGRRQAEQHSVEVACAPI